MTVDLKNRIDLDAWLADLQRLGGQARTLSENGASLRSVIDPADLKTLEEATRRLIASISRRQARYGLPALPDWDAAPLADAASAGEGPGPALTIPVVPDELSALPGPSAVAGMPSASASPASSGLFVAAGPPVMASPVAPVGHRAPATMSGHGPVSLDGYPGDGDPGLTGPHRNDPPRASARRHAGARHTPDHGIIGRSAAIRRVHLLIEKAAACALPVLVLGESGTGKELAARAIHTLSIRRDRRFFSENCSSLSESLLESELFGHVRGAFTGADRDRKGILELADGGTLFLDEIGDMSVRMQSKLLRALQEREFRPVGGRDTVRVNVRVISATNRVLAALVKAGAFREDLFYRINVITIEMPPLRERREDVTLLIDHFLDRFSRDTGLPRRAFTAATLDLMAGYDWPGNVRELENAVQRAVALSDARDIDAGSLPDRIRQLMVTDEAAGYACAAKAGEQLMIETALRSFDGDKTRAARYIGWSRPKLYRRMRHFRIPIRCGRET